MGTFLKGHQGQDQGRGRVLYDLLCVIPSLRNKVEYKNNFPFTNKTSIDPIHLTSSSEYYWLRHTGGQCHCALFCEVRMLGHAAFTRKPIAHQHGERGTVAACDVRARGQYWIFSNPCYYNLIGKRNFIE